MDMAEIAAWRKAADAYQRNLGRAINQLIGRQ